MIKSLRQILAFSILMVGLGTTASVMAADAAAAVERDKVCTKCHDASWDKPILSIYQTRHGVKADARTPGCQSCHGASSGHLGNPATPPDVVFTARTTNTAKQRNDACLACHTAGARAFWEGSQHESRDVACVNCHNIHAPEQKVLNKITQPEVCYTCHKTQRAEFKKISHMPVPEGKMTCSNCHNPHGSTGPKLLIKNTLNETCYTCHAEKRGPFLWEHAPVVDDCSNCHTPHGSTYTPLLKAKVPFLCQQCHSGDHGAQQNSGANLAGGANVTANGNLPLANAAARAQLAARACLNCHVLVHGSNHPAGPKFQR